MRRHRLALPLFSLCLGFALSFALSLGLSSCSPGSFGAHDSIGKVRVYYKGGVQKADALAWAKSLIEYGILDQDLGGAVQFEASGSRLSLRVAAGKPMRERGALRLRLLAAATGLCSGSGPRGLRVEICDESLKPESGFEVGQGAESAELRAYSGKAGEIVLYRVDEAGWDQAEAAARFFEARGFPGAGLRGVIALSLWEGRWELSLGREGWTQASLGEDARKARAMADAFAKDSLGGAPLALSLSGLDLAKIAAP
jgi:hypothetical protein